MGGRGVGRAGGRAWGHAGRDMGGEGLGGFLREWWGHEGSRAKSGGGAQGGKKIF